MVTIPLLHSTRRCGRAASAALRGRAHATRRNARHPGWVELGLKVSPEPTSARRCGSPSPLFQRIRRWREHLSPSSRRWWEAYLRRRPQHRSLLSQQRRHARCGAGEQPPMSQLGHKQTLRRRLGQVRFPSQSGHARDHLDASALCHYRTWPSHSITSSASASSVGGRSSPSALAVLRLITSSNLTACTTGRSDGFSPRRMRPA